MVSSEFDALLLQSCDARTADDSDCVDDEINRTSRFVCYTNGVFRLCDAEVLDVYAGASRRGGAAFDGASERVFHVEKR